MTVNDAQFTGLYQGFSGKTMSLKYSFGIVERGRKHRLGLLGDYPFDYTLLKQMRLKNGGNNEKINEAMPFL